MTTDLASPSTNTARESSDAPLIVGVSGLRGIVGQSLTPAVAARFAAAFGTWLVRREHPPVVVVGRDGRAGGDVIARAAIAGLQSVGVDVIDCGVSTTPTTAVMADQVEHAGLIITASHNPQAWNGMKAIWGHADAPAHLRGAAAPAPEYAREIIELFSGIFPHTPEPTAENLSGEGGLCDAVPGLKADVGFAQDPDADRLAIVDENGRYIGEEYTLALCAESVLSARDEETDGGGRRPSR
jgi:phosphomannomutase